MTPSEKALADIQEKIDQNLLEQESIKVELERLHSRAQDLRLDLRNMKSETIKLEATILQEKQAAEARAIDWERVTPYLEKAKLMTPDLLDFQVEDLAFKFDRATNPEGRFRGILNANAMGLGKTVETCAFLKVMGGNTLWLTKKSLVRSTTKEASRWGFGMLPLIGTGPQKDGMLAFAKNLPQLNIATNYETLNTNLDSILDIKWDYVVIDEVHRLKGGANAYPTLIWKNAKKLLETQKEAYPIFLTGSPIQNKIGDVWAYLHLFDPVRFDSRRKFEVMFDMNIDPQKLLKALAPNMIRRRKDEVGIQLPPKNKIDHEIEMPEDSEFRARYRELADKMFASFPEGNISIVNMIQHLHYLRAIAIAPGTLKYNEPIIDPFTHSVTGTIPKIMSFKPSYPKLDYCFELVCSLLDDEDAQAKADDTIPGGVIIWSAQFNAAISYLKELFESVGYKVGTMTGSTANAGEVERKFQQGEIQILICNQKSAAEGFNFQRSDQWPGGASHSVHLDMWWNPAINEQAEDRVWRTGTRLPVTIHRLLLDNSVDDLILDILDDKQYLIDGVMEQKALRPASEWKEKLQKILGTEGSK